MQHRYQHPNIGAGGVHAQSGGNPAGPQVCRCGGSTSTSPPLPAASPWARRAAAQEARRLEELGRAAAALALQENQRATERAAIAASAAREAHRQANIERGFRGN